MDLVQLIIPVEAAHATVTELGKVRPDPIPIPPAGGRELRVACLILCGW